MDNGQFENLITEAVEALPENIREKLNNVEIRSTDIQIIQSQFGRQALYRNLNYRFFQT